VLVLIAITFALGIAVGDWLSVSAAPALALALLAVGALLAARRRDGRIGLPALGLSLLLGVLAQATVRPEAPPELVDGRRLALRGQVVDAPERAFGAARVSIDLRAADDGDAEREASGRVQLTVAGEPTERLLPGDRVQVAATLRPPRGFRNPGAPDGARRAAAAGVMAVGGVHAPAGLVRFAAGPTGPPWLLVRRALAQLRNRMLDAVNARLVGDGRVLTASLVLGDRGDVDRPLDEAFRIAGVTHVLSVSGLHLAIAAFLFYVGLRRLLLRVPRFARGRPVARWAAIVALPATVAYTLVTGAQVATVRACVVAGMWLLAVALGRRSTATQALALSALVLLAWSPLELFDPSFQLSFAAALGTALLAPRWSPTGDGGPLYARLARFALRMLAASAAAILATLPITAWYFSQLQPAGLFTNLIVVPLAELLVVPTGLGGALLAAAHLSVGNALLLLAGFEAEVMAGFVRWCAGWAPAWRVAQPSAVEILAFYAGLGALALGVPHARRILVGCLLLVALAAGVRLTLARTSTTLTATFLDVGQGDACVLELPGGRVVVIDGGGSFDPAFDPGEQVIAPYLYRRGIRRIDLIVLSHPHPDHANGLGFLIENFEVGEVWTNGQETAQPGTVRLLAAAKQRHVLVPTPHPLTIAGVQFVPLAPFDAEGHFTIDPTLGENDNSLVVAVEYAGRRLLFAGDLEAEGEAALVARGNARADVLKVPHHGSRTSSSPELLDAVRPQVAVVSVGERNRWGFPNAAVVARYRAAGARFFRTDRDGAVVLTISRSGALGTP
jgi:competence protein ComEC